MNVKDELIDRLIDLSFAEDIGDGDHKYTVWVFFFLAYFTLYNRLQFHPPH